MALYTTTDDAKAYSQLAQDADADTLTREIGQAERDVDSVLALVGDRDQATGLKVNPADLEEWKAAALNRAVCAQIEYRLSMGPDFFVRAQHASVRGPDFSTTGKLPDIGPKTLRELDGTGLAVPRSGSSKVTGLLTPDADAWVPDDPWTSELLWWP